MVKATKKKAGRPRRYTRRLVVLLTPEQVDRLAWARERLRGMGYPDSDSDAIRWIVATWSPPERATAIGGIT